MNEQRNFARDMGQGHHAQITNLAVAPGRQGAEKPRHVADWPQDLRFAVPEYREDREGNELPRYRALPIGADEVVCQREDVPGGRLVKVGEEFYHEGPPSYYMEPVNQAAVDMTMQHPPGESFDAVSMLPI